MQRLDIHSKASIAFELNWQSTEAAHTERYLARKVNIWRDIFPPSMDAALMGLAIGESVTVQYCSGEALDSPDPELVRTFPTSCFSGQQFQGRPIVPREGRFYPRDRAFLECGCFPSDKRPMRIEALVNGHMTADLNVSLASYPFSLTATVENLHQKHGDTGGSLTHWMEEIGLNGPGMQARRMRDGASVPTDFSPAAPGALPLLRRDEADDGFFYAAPRMTGHIDAQASAFLRREYERLLPPNARVLDLMSSVQSHLPANHGYSVTGLGMNRAEMRANPCLDEHVLHDLNIAPGTPFDDGSFDAVLCSLSFEYLTHPYEMVAELARVLKPGGVLAFGLSNRWFPPKVTHLWTELHEFERMGFVLDAILRTGRFTDARTLSIRNWWRPEDDPHIRQTWISDPVYVVSALRS